jgi:hypothetical protein
MKSTPLIMSGPMIRAYMDGRKCVTRRTKGLDEINKRPDDFLLPIWDRQTLNGKTFFVWYFLDRKDTSQYSVKSPFGGARDELWFRETWAHCQPILDIKKPDGRLITEISDGYAEYRADGHETIQDLKDHVRLTAGHQIIVKKDRWIPSIHMPRKFCRFDHIPIISVIPERLSLVSFGNEAYKEGFEGAGPEDQVYNFYLFWDEKNANKGLGSDINPWVWRIEFEPYRST